MDGGVEFDERLIQHYDAARSRYTFYPTPRHFHPLFNGTTFRRALLTSNNNAPTRSLSLLIYIPFYKAPDDRASGHRTNPSQTPHYFACLKREVELLGQLLRPDRRVAELTVVGGTPSALASAQLDPFFPCIHRVFSLPPEADREWAVDLDSSDRCARVFSDLVNLGFNRVRLRPRNFQPQKPSLGSRRVNSDIRTAVVAARRAGLGSVGVEIFSTSLMQQSKYVSVALDQVIEARPDRVFLFRPPQKFHCASGTDYYRDLEFVGSKNNFAVFKRFAEQLRDAGYVYVGPDVFALPCDALVQALQTGQLYQNCYGYTAHGHCDLIGLGLGAISRIGTSLSQNTRDPHVYENQLNSGALPVECGIELTRVDLLREDIISDIMCQGWVDYASIQARHGIEFEDYFQEELVNLRAMETDGLLKMSADHFEITARGKPLLPVIAEVFDTEASSQNRKRPHFHAV